MQLVPGSLGENLSTLGWTETDVAIGDVYGAGTVVLQVTQPRSPCWKINERLGEPDASRWIADQGITGWYCRVLAGGASCASATNSGASSARRHRFRCGSSGAPSRRTGPDPSTSSAWLSIPGLAADWRRRLQERLEWLAKGGDGSR